MPFEYKHLLKYEVRIVNDHKLRYAVFLQIKVNSTFSNLSPLHIERKEDRKIKYYDSNL